MAAQPRYMFCPEQVRFDEEGVGRRMQTCTYEIHGDQGVIAQKSNRRVMRRIKWRQRNIAPVVVGPNAISVEPLPNPLTGPSFHIIQMSNNWEPDYLVDLIFRDTNSYVVGFRRQKRDKEGIWHKGTWYHYNEEDLPRWIRDNVVNLGFDSLHGDPNKIKLGGILTIHEMFVVLSKFEDCPRDPKTKKLLDEKDQEKLKKALFVAIIMFSEATRFRSILEAIAARIEDCEDSSELEKAFWNLIKNWEHISGKVVELCAGHSEMRDEAPPYFRQFQIRDPNTGEVRNINTVGDIIGAQSEFTLLMVQPESIATKEERERAAKKMKKSTAVPIPDPGFPDDNNEDDDD